MTVLNQDRKASRTQSSLCLLRFRSLQQTQDEENKKPNLPSLDGSLCFRTSDANMDAQLNLSTINSTSNTLNIHIYIHFVTPSRQSSLDSIYYTAILVLFVTSILLTIGLVATWNTLQASTSASDSESWSSRTSGRDSLGSESDHEARNPRSTTEKIGRRWVDCEFFHVEIRNKSD
jgi:hypothetical protein